MSRPRSGPSPRLIAALGEDTARNLADVVGHEAAKDLDAAVAELAKVGQLRSLTCLIQLFVASHRRTEQETAARFDGFREQLDQILGWLGPSGELPPSLNVKLERHHRETSTRLDRLTDEVGDKVLAADSFSLQAIGLLTEMRREFVAVRAEVGQLRADLAELRRAQEAESAAPLAPPEPPALAIAVGEEQQPIILFRQVPPAA